MIKRLWKIYLPVAATLLIGFPLLQQFGPGIEGAVAPIRGDQQITDVVRGQGKICWSWTFTKLRAIASAEMEAFIDVNDEANGVTYVYERESGRPWGITKYAVPPRKPPYTLHYCSPVPPYVIDQDSIRIRQTASYPGFLNLWKLDVPFPDVESPGATTPH